MKEYKVYESGTKGVTKLNQIEGFISGVCIRGVRVTYEFNYFAEREYKTIWLDEFEFTVEVPKKAKIGFKK